MKNLTALCHEAIISPACHQWRLDQALAACFPQYSRSQLQTWIRQGNVTVDGKQLKPRAKVQGNEKIILHAVLADHITWQACEITLPLLYEDEAILVINKPVGMVVHPAAGNGENTLANALLHHCPSLATMPRAGIVHRLDKETSGLLVVAKTPEVQTSLVAQLQKHEIHREYYAIVNGVLISGGTVDAPIGRHPVYRQKMAVVQKGAGKSAVTHYRVVERFRAHTLIKVLLETGRTHQIRVHLAYKGYPLLGDATYGARPVLPKAASAALMDAIRQFRHQALHAKKLRFYHPVRHEMVGFEAPVPEEMVQLIALLRENNAES